MKNSQKISKGYLELPSFTFCPNPLGYLPKSQENRTFEEYMEDVLTVTDFFDNARQSVFLPGKK